jgi:hypothetical protein
LIDALIAKKAKVEVANEFESTPLAEAAKLADARMVKTCWMPVRARHRQSG